MTPEYIQQVVDRVGDRLSVLGKLKGVVLRVLKEDTKYEDDWLYVCVTSPQANVRASDYAELLSDIEEELRAARIENVLLVPTRDH